MSQARFSRMIARAEALEPRTMGEIRSLVRQSLVNTDHAAAAAARIEQETMATWTREQKIAVFFAGLVANLVDDPEAA